MQGCSIDLECGFPLHIQMYPDAPSSEYLPSPLPMVMTIIVVTVTVACLYMMMIMNTFTNLLLQVYIIKAMQYT